MKEFFESFFDTLKTRYRNKFIGTFFLVYLGLNWEKLIALLYISEFKYQDFINIWVDTSYQFWIKIFLASLISLIYLIASPWISYFIHYIQSAAVTKYKLKSVENEMEFIEKKQHMEMQRAELIEIQTKNVEAEAEISLKKEGIDNPDLLKFKKLIVILTEYEIRKCLLDIKNYIFGDFFESLKLFLSEISTIENEFEDDEIRQSAKDVEEIAKALFGDIKKLRSQSLSLNDKEVKILNDSLESFLDAYRKFYVLGKNL